MRNRGGIPLSLDLTDAQAAVVAEEDDTKAAKKALALDRSAQKLAATEQRKFLDCSDMSTCVV